MKFSELQKILKIKLGIDHLADIARELGVTPQAVSNWKSRDRVPYKYVIYVREKIKTSDVNDDSIIISEENNVEYQKKLHSFFETDTFSVLDIFILIAKHLRLIILSVFMFSIISLFYLQFFAKPIFQSNAKFMSSSSSSNSIQSSGLAAQFGFTIPYAQGKPEWAYNEIIKSRTMARKMLKRKFDTIKYGPQKSLLYILSSNKNISDINNDNNIKSVINTFINMIEIDQNGSLYDLTINASEPLFARDLVSSLISELDSHQRKYNKDKASETRRFIEDRIGSTKLELQSSEESLKNFRDSNRRIQNSPALLLEQQRLAREVSVLTGVFTTLKQQLETTKIDEVKESEYVIILDPPEAPIHRFKPKKKRFMYVASIFGFLFGIMFAFLKEFVNQNKNEKFIRMKSLAINNIQSIFSFAFFRFGKK